MNYSKLREEPLKNAVRDDFFKDYGYTQLGNIDFVIESFLWAEAKQGKSHDIFESFVQLILTIGKEKTFEKYLPPKYIGAFDAEKFAFIEYHSIQEVFYQNDFNWNVAPSNHETKEFKQLHALCERQLSENSILFKYATDSKELQKFIKLNFKSVESDSVKISVTKNNFVFVFQKWTESVKDSIAVDWEKAQKSGIIPADFFLADLLSSENESLKENLFVVLKKTKYELAKRIDDMGFLTSMSVGFLDNQRDHRNFWAIYERPPKEEYWDYIIGRRDLLVPQDIRERKGSFFTPQIWVEKSQQYLAAVLGENWQDEYYIWDCCAGTGNLLNGLTNYRNVWASTLDKADVDVMVDRIRNGWNMFENHVFQMDFLNDDFSKCPEELQKIINDPKKREKLVIYINPPYAEAPSRIFEKDGKIAVEQSATNKKYANLLGQGNRELFTQFFTRIYFEIPGCVLAEFSKLKHLQGQHFVDFRKFFLAKLEKMFVVPANTFDNVKGSFPIGFIIWDTSKKEKFTTISSDVFSKEGEKIGNKNFYSYDNAEYINEWIKPVRGKRSDFILGKFPFMGNDFQQQSIIQINHEKMVYNKAAGQFLITPQNLIWACVYFAVRKTIVATWLNDRDQFFAPNKDWEKDEEFQSNCLIWTLFNNNIQSEYGENHWIPFTEREVGCKNAFKSDFMHRFINGEVEIKTEATLFNAETTKKSKKMVFSPAAQAVYDAGLELWRYYHAQKNANPDASFYDIRKYFQGETNGRMNATSEDEKYTALIQDLRGKMKVLAAKIAVKVYEYGFLK